MYILNSSKYDLCLTCSFILKYLGHQRREEQESWGVQEPLTSVMKAFRAAASESRKEQCQRVWQAPLVSVINAPLWRRTQKMDIAVQHCVRRVSNTSGGLFAWGRKAAKRKNKELSDHFPPVIGAERNRFVTAPVVCGLLPVLPDRICDHTTW